MNQTLPYPQTCLFAVPTLSEQLNLKILLHIQPARGQKKTPRQVSEKALTTEISNNGQGNSQKTNQGQSECSASTSRHGVSQKIDEPKLPNVSKSVKEISPLPDVNKVTKRKKISTSVVEVLTSTPYKDKLIQKEKEKEEKLKKMELRLSGKQVIKKGYKNKPVTVNRKIDFEASSKNSQVDSEKNTKKRIVESSWFCKICEVAKEEDMIQCLKCFDWFHVVCAGVKPSKKMFYCSFCKD